MLVAAVLLAYALKLRIFFNFKVQISSWNTFEIFEYWNFRVFRFYIFRYGKPYSAE